VNLEEFFQAAREPDKPNFRQWIVRRGFKGLYLRYGGRLVNGEMFHPVLDIANVEVRKPGKGTFKRFIATLRRRYPELHIYIENVLVPPFGKALLRMGFVCVKGSLIPDISQSYFLVARKPSVPIEGIST